VKATNKHNEKTSKTLPEGSDWDMFNLLASLYGGICYGDKGHTFRICM